MFTGLIQSVGKIQILGDDQLRVVWGHSTPSWITQDLAIGDSVSVDGICLTVIKILPAGFVADASPETLRRTTLERLEESVHVNLETSLRMGSKLGGHFVTGHVDGVGYLESAVQTANAWEMSFTVPDPRVTRYIVPKGSIAVNGVSLTVADCNPTGSWFVVAVIPLTYADTNLQYLQPGSPVNLEGDVLGKYVEKFLRLGTASQEMAIADLEPVTVMNGTGDLTSAFLAEHGYL